MNFLLFLTKTSRIWPLRIKYCFLMCFMGFTTNFDPKEKYQILSWPFLRLFRMSNKYHFTPYYQIYYRRCSHDYFLCWPSWYIDSQILGSFSQVGSDQMSAGQNLTNLPMRHLRCHHSNPECIKLNVFSNHGNITKLSSEAENTELRMFAEINIR